MAPESKVLAVGITVLRKSAELALAFRAWMFHIYLRCDYLELAILLGGDILNPSLSKFTAICLWLLETRLSNVFQIKILRDLRRNGR